MKGLDEEILKVCSTEEIEGEIEEADKANNHVLAIISKCERFAHKKQKTSGHDPSVTVLDPPESVRSLPPASPSHGAVSLKVVKPKLPKLMIPKFNGR